MNPIVTLLTCCLMLATLASAVFSPVVKTKSGPVRGGLIRNPENKQDVYEFLGIPFAKPPTGELRFRKPVAVKPWSNTLDAVKSPNMCMQPHNPGNSDISRVIMIEMNLPISEDCLYLSMWVPKSAIDSKSNKRLATLIRIHGGAWTEGSEVFPLYNGTILAGHENIIVVSIQYRLGSLGFAYFGTKDEPGNVGLWDQLEAMKWVSKNIAAFGGDPKAITISGEGVGAGAVSLHLLSTYSRPYFQKAILESGAAVASWSRFDKKTALTVSDMVFKAVASKHCDQSVLAEGASMAVKMKCLRSADASAFPEADIGPIYGGYGFGLEPVIDGDFLRQQPREMLQKGDFSKVPLLLGGNANEGSLFFVFNPDSAALLPLPGSSITSLDHLNASHFTTLLTAGYLMTSIEPSFQVEPAVLLAMQRQYAPSRGGSTPKGADILEAAIQAATDYALRCPPYTWAWDASKVLKAANKQVFVYLFNQRASTAKNPKWMGVTHGDEAAWVFGHPFQPFFPDMKALTSDEKKLCKQIMEYWGNFVKRGNPNMREENVCKSGDCVQLPRWPPYRSPQCQSEIFKLSVETTVKNNGKATKCMANGGERCAFWDYWAYMPYKNDGKDYTSIAQKEPIRYYGDSDYDLFK